MADAARSDDEGVDFSESRGSSETKDNIEFRSVDHHTDTACHSSQKFDTIIKVGRQTALAQIFIGIFSTWKISTRS